MLQRRHHFRVAVGRSCVGGLLPPESLGRFLLTFHHEAIRKPALVAMIPTTSVGRRLDPGDSLLLGGSSCVGGRLQP